METHGVRRFGALGMPDGSVHWRVWAPYASHVELVLFDGQTRRTVAMERQPRGLFEVVRSDVDEGQRYAYRLNEGSDLPDPCSLWQPDGVHRPSAVLRPEWFRWSDEAWEGVSRENLVIYELHVGTFTPEGTFESIIPRIDSLLDL